MRLGGLLLQLLLTTALFPSILGTARSPGASELQFIPAGTGKALLCGIPARAPLLELAACPAGTVWLCGSRSGDSLLALSKPLLPAAVSVQNLHLCEGYVGRDGRSHPGFYCPRLTDPPGHRYCCQPSPRALKSCCSQLALEALTGVNLSSLASPELLRNPLALPFVGLYGLLVLLLMAIDLCHFYWTRRCHLGRLLPCAHCPPCRPRGGHLPRAQPSHGAPSLPRPSRGC
ncbi:protein shisa-like-1 [Manacus vitellinus]|uniref:protein shisa-like-1 n=1 Tax=Manacus vitellinus TaxID=328815 RepID=UPI00115D5425|nr:protein shisa-like-1 [Manacus vitellinus]